MIPVTVELAVYVGFFYGVSLVMAYLAGIEWRDWRGVPMHVRPFIARQHWIMLLCGVALAVLLTQLEFVVLWHAAP